jgi:hypothetical protein
MGLLNQQGKKGDKKNNKSQPKNNNGSKFMNKAPKSGGGFAKKPMTGGSQRGS